jgi:hypothetical protein
MPSTGSDTAGLITCERCEGCFGAWGRPLAFHSRKLSSLSRDEEARDKARSALELPLWTLGDDLDHVLSSAGTDRPALIDKLRLKADGKLTEEQVTRGRTWPRPHAALPALLTKHASFESPPNLFS